MAEDDADQTDRDQPVTIAVLDNDSDQDGDELSVESFTQATNGSVDCDDSECTYTPNRRFKGDDSFEYTVSDDNGGTDTATVSVEVLQPVGLRPGRCTITGTPGADTLSGTPGRDLICGLSGDDIINGLGNNDIVIGSAGDDELHGGEGNDYLDGGTGDDRLFGEAGNDGLNAHDRVPGNDLADGGAGRDYCRVDHDDQRVSCQPEDADDD